MVQFAGAHNPLWIVRGTTVLETAADKQPIGRFDHAKPFKTNTVALQKGDTMCLFTDGFSDQFGGEKGKKFKAKPMKELLISIHDKSAEEQKKLIHQSFEMWRGKLEQVDDVCLLAVSI